MPAPYSKRPSGRTPRRTDNPISSSRTARTSPFSRTRTQRTDVAPRTSRSGRALPPESISTKKPTRAVRHAASAAKAKLEQENNANPEYPMRINKYLAQKGYATRKAADTLIDRRRVFINNKRAVLGDKVSESDVVEVRLDKRDPAQKLVYFAYNKPRGVITHSPQGDEESDIRENIPEVVGQFNVFPVGRLDKDSHGLIILTNDGRVTDRLLSPTREHEKEYIVRTKSKLRDSFKTNMEAGVFIEGYQTKPAKVNLINDTMFSIRLTEGKKHQIRRMVVALFNEVSDLQRTRVLNIELGKLKTGEYRAIEGDELQVFLKSLGL